ncbi:MAG: PhoH family protein [Deltaproteobacteria bacterium]|jgi:phosphate starvation-inducible PhoH-like protein|nr:PhoH family protein [Deltaproteobacteria bacterium]
MSAEESIQQLDFDDPRLANFLFGPQGRNLRRLEEKSGLRISSRGSSLHLTGPGPAQSLVSNLLYQLYRLLKEGDRLYPADVEQAYAMLERDPELDLVRFYGAAAFLSSPRRKIIPKSLTQREYVKSLRDNEVTFAVGPAGTGKTYLAVAVALDLLLNKKVKRIVLARPAVEAGERLGFLPGDLAEKVNPYLRPLYDALHDMLDFEKVSEMIEGGVIEIAPLAFMRGRTLNDAFIILDEAQNTTPEQMKMFLTRMGFGSRMAVTGDVTQIDLPISGNAERSGMVHALRVLRNVQGLGTVCFTKDDVIRHPMVARIVEAYER